MRRHHNKLIALCLVLAAFVVAGLMLHAHGLSAETAGTSALQRESAEVTVRDADAEATDEVVSDEADDAEVEAAEEGEAPEDDADETPAAEAPAHAVRTASIPEGADYEPDVALVALAEGVTAEEVNELIARTPGVVPHTVSADELQSGVLKLELAEGTQLEDALNALLESEAVDVAQPNYIYYMQLGDEADFRELLAQEALPGQDVPPEAEAGEQEAAGADAADVEEADAPAATDADAAAAADEDASTDVTEQESEGDMSDPAADDPAEPGETDEPSMEEKIAQLVNDLHSTPGQDSSWNLSSIRAYEAWTLARCEGTVGMAVFDNCPNFGHEDLAANVAPGVGVYDATAAEGEDASSYGINTAYNHGTHVAGIVGAVANNEIGVAGVSYNPELLLVNVFVGTSSSSASLLKAYDYVMEQAEQHNVRVVNLSVGGALSEPIGDTMLVRQINKAFERGIVTVASSGNSKSGLSVPYYEYPGDAVNVVSVMNLERHSSGALVRSSQSNYNVAGQTNKNICAPGTRIYSTYASSTAYGTSTGTSMAAPHVAGVLALEFAANPSLTAREAVSVLYATALDLGDEGWDEDFGYGQADAYAAVQAALDPDEVARIAADETYLPGGKDLEEDAEDPLPAPTISGATRIPVGGVATYKVTNGSVRIKGSAAAASLSGTTLVGKAPGTVTLAVLDEAGKECTTLRVEVYGISGFWTLASAQDTSLVAGVSLGKVTSGANVLLQKGEDARHQAWRFERLGDGTFMVRSAKAGKVLHVADGSTKSGANVVQSSASKKSWQRWRLEVDANNAVSLVSVRSGCALTVSGTPKVAANIVQKADTGAAGQKWVLEPSDVEVGPIWEGVYRVSSGAGKSYVLNVAGSSKKSGANVNVRKSTKAKSQRWLFTYLGDGLYRVTPQCSRKVLSVKGGSKKAGANVIQRTNKKYASQTWRVVANKDGSYSIRRSGTSLALALAKSKAGKDVNVIVAKRKSSAKNQKWWLSQY